MNSFSIWHWLIVLVVLVAVPVGVAAIATSSNKGDSRLGRGAYAARTIGLCVGLAIVNLVIDSAVVSTILGILMLGFAAYWSVDRLRDAGNPNHKQAMLIGVPIVGFFYWIYLMIIPTKPSVRDQI